ncbi:hypothetical protein E2C01_017089 [Portunus trituberculatus]|uniref:Uncharacterized protein n=1 Tax=Portunus trituberculatus TaxID=210409 RepID=A0A5B7DSI0_PORTR|nr:hypothetical protein [Portunus trituberculatus]
MAFSVFVGKVSCYHDIPCDDLPSAPRHQPDPFSDASLQKPLRTDDQNPTFVTEECPSISRPWRRCRSFQPGARQLTSLRVMRSSCCLLAASRNFLSFPPNKTPSYTEGRGGIGEGPLVCHPGAPEDLARQHGTWWGAGTPGRGGAPGLTQHHSQQEASDPYSSWKRTRAGRWRVAALCPPPACPAGYCSRRAGRGSDLNCWGGEGGVLG